MKYKDHFKNTIEITFGWGERFEDDKTFRFKEQSYQSRGASMISLIKKAVEKIDKPTQYTMSDFKVKFLGGDCGAEITEGWEGLPPYSVAGQEYSDYIIPDWSFLGWPETGKYDYVESCAEILEASKKEPTDDRLFWAGNTSTHPTRKQFVELVAGDNRIYTHDVINWRSAPGLRRYETISGKFTSLPEHCQYKYLIDIQGVGYSARIKDLMHTGRPLFIPDRRWKEYWHFELWPFVHYIPVKEDLSDFYEMFEWAEKNYDECLRIAKNAQEFAIENLSQNHAIDRYKDTLLRLGNEV